MPDGHRPAHRLVTDDEVDEAHAFLRESARKIGRARGAVVRTEAMVNAVRALIIVHDTDGSFQLRKEKAMATDRYRAAIEDHAAAVTEFEALKAERENAIALIETWRSEGANLRGRL